MKKWMTEWGPNDVIFLWEPGEITGEVGKFVVVCIGQTNT